MQRGFFFLFWKRAFVNGVLWLVNTFAMQKDKIVKASQQWSRRSWVLILIWQLAYQVSK